MKSTIKLLLVFGCASIVGWSAWIYFQPAPHPYTCIPVRFLKNQSDPIIEVQIENIPCLLEIDLGAKGVLHLKKIILDKIQKEKVGEVVWLDIRSNEYASPVYKLPSFEAHGARFRNVTCCEEDLYFSREGSVIFKADPGRETSQEHLVSGRLGQELFIGVDSFFDLQKNQLFLIKNKKQFEKDFYSIKDYVEVPYEICNAGMVILASTPHGIARLLVDTGCSKTLITSSFLKEFLPERYSAENKIYYDTSSFIMGQHDFGDQEMTLLTFELPIPIRDKIDGMLGMDFLKSHRFYIDVHNRKIFFEKEAAHLEIDTSDEKKDS